MTNGDKTGESWSGSLTTTTDDGNSTGTRGGHITIDPAGHVTATNITSSENGNGTSATVNYTYSGSNDTAANGTKSIARSERTDKYTTTTTNAPASGDKPASKSSADTHGWTDYSLSATITDSSVAYDHTHEEHGNFSTARGIDATTVTISGERASARITSSSSSRDESFDKSRTDTDAPWETAFYEEDYVSRNAESSSSDYSSSHTVDQYGLAHGGTFQASSSLHRTRAEFSDVAGDVDYGTEEHDQGAEAENRAENHTIKLTELKTETSERGSYEDLALAGGGAIRLQSGTYKTKETFGSSNRYDFERVMTYLDTLYSEAHVYSEETHNRKEDVSQTKTRGSYDPYGQSEERDFSRTLDDYQRTDKNTHYDADDSTSHETDLYKLNLTTQDGQTTGHEYHRHWIDNSDDTTYEFLTPIVDRDIFDEENPPPETPVDPHLIAKSPSAAESLIVPVADVTPPKPPRRRDILDDIMRKDAPPLRGGSYMMGHAPTHERAVQTEKDLTELQGIIADTNPLTAGIQMGSRVGLGHDPVRNQDVSAGARWAEGLLTAVPAIAGVIANEAKFVQKLLHGFEEAEGVAAEAGKAENVAEGAVTGAKPKVAIAPSRTFPHNADDLLSELPRNAKGHIHTSDYVRIRPEQHALKPGEVFNPRHHGPHYHVDIRLDPLKSWGNKNNVFKVEPPGYTPGSGTGFLPDELFPGW